MIGSYYRLNFQQLFLEAAATGEGGRGERRESEEGVEEEEATPCFVTVVT